MHAEYRGFFLLGMMTRNERNAIIQHGTMTMIRRSALVEMDGWAEWCITEDAELGLRLFEAGYKALYIPFTYGRGLMPDSFSDFKKQRYRWAYGAVRILAHHRREFLGTVATKLDAGQRYHFAAGWLPWFADGFNLLFNLAALFWTVAMVGFELYVTPPYMTVAMIPLVLFAFKVTEELLPVSAPGGCYPAPEPGRGPGGPGPIPYHLAGHARRHVLGQAGLLPHP